MFEAHTIHPNAVPTVSGMLKIPKIPATKNGYDPKPLLVKAKEKLPTTNVIISVEKAILEVSFNAKVAV